MVWTHIISHSLIPTSQTTMKTSQLFKPLVFLVKKPSIILLPILLFFAGWWFALPSKKHDEPKTSTVENSQVWTCSMHPQIRQPNPGLCPICNMDLIPLKSENNNAGLREISLSAAVF